MSEDTRVRFHVIEGGGHMFSRKHDILAMEILSEFAELV